MRDWWIGDRNLEAQFPPLNCATDKDTEVNSYMSRVGDMVVWSPTFRRNLRDQEESQFILLLNLLNEAYIMERGEDSRVWTASKDGSFSISSFFSALSDGSRERNVVGNVWKIKAPMRVVIFVWLSIQRRILTHDDLTGGGG